MNQRAIQATITLAVSLVTTLLFASPTPDTISLGKETSWRFVTWQGNNRLVTVSATHAIVWDTATGKQRSRHPLGAAPAHVLAESPVSPDGKRLVTVTAKPKAGSRIVSLEDGPELVLTAPDKGGPFQFVSWAPDGGRLLFIDADHVLHLWDATSGKYVSKVGGPTDNPTAGQLTFGPPKIYRQTTYRSKPKPDNKVDAWFQWKELGEVGGGEGDYSEEAWRRPLWAPDGQTLLTMSLMKSPAPLVVLWDGRTGAALTSLAVPNRLYHQWAFSPDGRQFALLSADIDQGRITRRDTPWNEAVKDDYKTMKVPPDAVALRLFDLGTGATLHRLEGVYTPSRFAWSPDAKRLVATGKSLTGNSPTHDLASWDAATGRFLWSQPWQPEWYKPGTPVFSPDGKYFALTVERPPPPTSFENPDLLLRVHDASTGKMVLEKKFDELFLEKVPPDPVWSPAGSRVCAGSLVIDVKSGKVLCDLFPERKEGRTAEFRAVWQPGGHLLAVWQENAVVRLVPADTGKEVRQLAEGKP